MAGGTFWSTDSDNSALFAISTGTFLVLSASLAKATLNQTYLDAAIQSADFINTHLENDGSILEIIDAESCSQDNGVNAYNSGLLIEGLTILASITRNATIGQLLQIAVSAGTSLSRPWHHEGDGGVISEGQGKSGDLFLVRGLGAAYRQNMVPSEMQEYIKGYLGVQYNAVLDQATINGSNIYGVSWVGPPPLESSATGQVQALAVLVNGIVLSNNSDPDPPVTTSTPSLPTAKSSLNIRAIVGGVVGSVVLIGIAAPLLYICGQRKMRVYNDIKAKRQGRVDPFVVGHSHSPNTRQAFSSHSRMTTKKQTLGRTLTSVDAIVTQDSKTSLRVSGPRADYERTQNTRAQGRDEMSTEHLLRLLAERIQPGGQWREDEPPPEYPASRIESI
ncbi:hypothetical protein VKT23_020108 [Stygiomarasmius scandens]